MEIHHDLNVLAKVVAVALAVGLDVFAIFVGVGVPRVASRVRIRLGLAFVLS